MTQHGGLSSPIPDPPAYRPITSRRDSLPWWVVLLSGALVLLGAFYFVTNLAPPGGPLTGGSPSPGASGPPATDAGEPVDVAAAQSLIEEGGCQGCHGANLEGQGSFPALTAVAEGPVSDNLQDLGREHPDDWAQLWIHGTNEEVAGIDRLGMPTFSERFTPEEIDLIVRYLKTL